MASLPKCMKSGKVCFSKKEAQTKANQLEKLNNRQTRYYYHPDCDCWHISTVQDWKFQREKKQKRDKPKKFDKNKALQDNQSY